MLSSIANFFLIFTHAGIIIPLLILGYIWLDRKIFFHAAYIVLISILFNIALKVTFQISLSPTLNSEGFAFPSGHMQSGVVLYGWLIINSRNILHKLLMITLLIGIAWSLVYFGYHNYFDILGSILFGSFLVFSYTFIVNVPRKKRSIILWAVSTFLLLYIASVYQLKHHIWIVYFALISLIFLDHFLAKKWSYN